MNDNNDIEVETDTHSHHNARHKNRAYTEDSLHSVWDPHPITLRTAGTGPYPRQIHRLYSMFAKEKAHTHQQDIDDLKGKNAPLEQGSVIESQE
uniref:Uncharacterized protein n=1 Tax=Canis lupus familiaris TaxID=9615 RepID=A0A8C0N5T1_CANLF